MKTKSFISLLSLTLGLIVSVFSFTSCGGGDDDEHQISSSSIEGTWYLINEKNYSDDTFTTMLSEESYNKNDTRKKWNITYQGQNLHIIQNDSRTLEFIKVSNNVYQYSDDRYVIKSISSTLMIVEYIDHYYTTDSSKEDKKDFVIYTFTK